MVRRLRIHSGKLEGKGRRGKRASPALWRLNQNHSIAILIQYSEHGNQATAELWLAIAFDNSSDSDSWVVKDSNRYSVDR